MKKHVSLILALLMCLCALSPVLAEDDVLTAMPDLNLPVTISQYKAAYEAIVAANAPSCTVSWQELKQDGSTIWMAVINDSFTSLMVLMDGKFVAEIACLVQNTLSEDTLMAFLSMAGYGGAAVMLDEDTSAEDASAAFMLEIANVFSAISQGVQPESICGLPGGLSVSPLQGEAYQYYFVLRLDAGEIAAE